MTVLTVKFRFEVLKNHRRWRVIIFCS